MGRYYHRPLLAVDFGDVATVGSGVVLGDSDDATLKRYVEDAGSICVYPTFNRAGIVPSGKQIIAVRVGHRQRNTGFAGLYNGWPMSFLRISNVRQTETKAYKQDGYIDGGREILGPPLYNTDLTQWTDALITSMTSEVSEAVGEIGPSSNRWCVASEAFIQIVWEEAVPVPAPSYPANGATIATSGVDFKAVLPAAQEEQPVRAIFQVARDSGFTTDVRDFVGGLNSSTTPGTLSMYDSEVLTDTYTGLGPGTWYFRLKGRDFRGAAYESAWSATYSFSISHTALPVPSLTEPQPGTTIPTPYGVRRALISTQPSGERMVGVTWQFSKVSDFSSGVVQWTNRTNGMWIAPEIVSYDSQPNAEVLPSLDGYSVSLEDPSQYLSQGSWYARVRATDVYGQSGAWSSNYTFSVSHIPLAENVTPRDGKAFDQHSTPVTWKFSDPWNGDSMSAARMRVYTLADVLLQDTGKVIATTPRLNMSILDTYQQADLKILLDVWDRDDVQSTSPTVAYFRLSLSPVVTVPYPAPDETIITGQPAISWTVVYSHGGITQKNFRVKYIDTGNGTTVWDSGVIVGAAGTYTPPKAVLKNMRGYQLALTVTDTDDLSTTVLRNFTTNFERPAYVPGFADSGKYLSDGYVEVYWPAGVPDPYFFEWRIYRRKKGVEDWTYAGAVADPATRVFRDWLVGGSGEFEYTVTQAATRFGSIVESEYNDLPNSVQVFSDSYWMIYEEDETYNTRLWNVTGDKFTGRKETNGYVILGRGWHENKGTRIGKEGNLTAEIRPRGGMTAREIYSRLEQLDIIAKSVIMKDPFGNLTRITIGEITADRLAGIGFDEFLDIDIPYKEVR